MEREDYEHGHIRAFGLLPNHSMLITGSITSELGMTTEQVRRTRLSNEIQCTHPLVLAFKLNPEAQGTGAREDRPH